MTSKPRIDPAMQNSISDDRSTPPTPSTAYCPSVPISVYRELSAELQSAQARLDSLSVQNQQLAKQNQQLRQEVQKVIQSAQHLQQVVDYLPQGVRLEVPQPNPEPLNKPRPMTAAKPPQPVAHVPVIEEVAPPSPPRQLEAPAPIHPEKKQKRIIEQESRPRRVPSAERSTDVSGWLLVVAIFLIVATAFGTGFVIVRPLLNNSNR
jgi:hypothetical protein